MKMILFILIFATCCNEQTQTSYNLSVGATYKICGPHEKNPFEKQGKATVIITDKKAGYVQYCWDYEVNDPDRTLFSRSEKEFIEQINLCNK
jgi:hypothetical protein